MVSTIIMACMLTTCKQPSEIFSTDTTGTSFCTEVAGDSCTIPKDRPRPMFDIGTNIIESPGVQYFSPSVNPNNSQEFVCIKRKGASTSIVVYNIKTDEERIISTFSSHSRGKVAWGKKNWISYSEEGRGTIQIFKSDGSDKKVLAKDLYATFRVWPPAWSPDGIYLYYQTKDDKGRFGVIRHYNGSEYARTPLIDKPDWNKNNVTISFNWVNVITYDIRSNVLDTIARQYTRYSSEFAEDIKWLPNKNHAVFIQEHGMYRIDTKTGEILQMKEKCNMKSYQALSVSDKGNFILCEKKMTSRHSYYDYYEYSEIWKMDINGCNEVRILPKTVEYESNPYNEDTDDFAKRINSSHAPHKTEFSAKFLPKVLNPDFIDNTELAFTKLKDAVKPEALAMIDSVLSRQTGEWDVVKMYPKRTSNNKILNASGYLVDGPILFSWLKITIPEGEDIEITVRELRKLNKVFIEVLHR